MKFVSCWYWLRRRCGQLRAYNETAMPSCTNSTTGNTSAAPAQYVLALESILLASAIAFVADII